jgi:trehalose 6-phosphate phosphatase
MKSSSPPRKKLIKDGADTAYGTWMVMLASLLANSFGNMLKKSEFF